MDNERISVSERTAGKVLVGILEGCDTRGALAERLRMNKMTVGRAVRIWLERGILTEQIERAKRGKPVGRLILNEKRCYLILRMEPERGYAVLADPCGVVLQRIGLPYDSGIEPWHQLDACLGRAQGMAAFCGRSRSVAYTALSMSVDMREMRIPEGRFALVRYEEKPDIPLWCHELNQCLGGLIFVHNK